jgi:hypothetical protein
VSVLSYVEKQEQPEVAEQKVNIVQESPLQKEVRRQLREAVGQWVTANALSILQSFARQRDAVSM